jgi:uncharacterized protein YjbI with pentapeptide repeats
MADEKHVALLKQGREVWNAWREANSDIVPYLRYADLGGADLTGADLTGATLRDAYLYSADLRDAYLYDANLPERHEPFKSDFI